MFIIGGIMEKIKKDKKKILILIFIFTIILFFMYNLAKNKKSAIQNDFIFLKLFSSEKLINNQETDDHKSNQYNIEVIKNSKNYKQINFLQTIDSRTLVNKKVAPGTEGHFNIILTSNLDTNYEIKLISKSQKPRNLVFQINEQQGTIKARETKKIPVVWKWEYYKDKKQDKQDTDDGKNIEKYEFEICTIGK